MVYVKIRKNIIFRSLFGKKNEHEELPGESPLADPPCLCIHFFVLFGLTPYFTLLSFMY